MGSSSDEEGEISESDIDECVENIYSELKSGKHLIKNYDGTFRCPFCKGKKKQDYRHKDLLQHATGVGASSNRGTEEKAKHQALGKFLKEEVPDEPGHSNEQKELPKPLTMSKSDDLLVFPWMGIIVNIETDYIRKDGKYVGLGSTQLKDELEKEKLRPVKVHAKWNHQGHTGKAVVDFHKDWTGHHDAMSFEKHYAELHRGKKQWFHEKRSGRSHKKGFYGWVARLDDYEAEDIIGKHLRQNGDLKTVADLAQEQERRKQMLVQDLANEIDNKNRRIESHEEKLKEMEYQKNELDKKLALQDEAHRKELKKERQRQADNWTQLMEERNRHKATLDLERDRLERRHRELERLEAHNDAEKKKLEEEKRKNALKNSSLEKASLEQKIVDGEVKKLMEHHKIEQERLANVIRKQQKELNEKQTLEVEIQKLKGELVMMKHMGGENNSEVCEKMKLVTEELQEKENEMESLEELNSVLVSKERETNDELQAARKEAIQYFKDQTHGRAHIGVKRMGVLDEQPFYRAVKAKLPNEDWQLKASELCSLWDAHTRDPAWHPFKTVSIDGKDREVIDENDEKFKELRDEYGDEVCKAVETAMLELNDYNPSGRYPVPALWHFKEGRQASLQEVIHHFVKQNKTKKRKRT
ncbi:hypothetical protein AMTRI_Chr08g203900 [Amborella trichopoda]|uniref:Factor of DNA methylation 1-5/IDN2 domain-containing protein n=1 Tax=Amborella trichopoda TaxID=13333 RepID=W1PD92_AMBTC|nr:protein INVOLVED IN DE NOVO 2 [Amborella trichopoda]XP_020524075.1 protein INVOLVED IN DE NOVO 2 [Amborella trichopoda]XP_020524076.1 protein INVOLVED IN DE NOVO 2 [Amborella trichopoda]ERN07897.1 hypothetical protein AMTR_s00012p00230440 [Amborella trichopoda]|eukprot:XP_006846222.1 protein INVOLVED IN DE NOVO 2 [Amborella trichopoda]